MPFIPANSPATSAPDEEWEIAPVDLTVPAGDSTSDTALLYELTGRNQTWISACSDAVLNRTAAAVALISDEAGSYLRAFQASINTTAAGLGQAVENFDLRAAHGIRDLANALAGASNPPHDADLPGACQSILDHCDEAQLHSIGPGDLTAIRAHVAALTGREPFRRLLAVIDYLGSTDRPSAPFVALLACHLAKVLPKPLDSEDVRVLLAQDPLGRLDDDKEERQSGRLAEPGLAGWLTLTRIQGGPPGLHPDPRRMAFFDSADDRFIRSAANAWSTSKLSVSASNNHSGASRGHCVLWSVTLDAGVDRPCNQFDGGSLGGAFAVALHEIAGRTTFPRLHSVLRRADLGLQPRRIDPRSAVSAAVLDADGHLGSVGHLTRKIEAAAREGIRLVVVSSADRASAVRAAEPYEIEVQGADSTAQAIRCTRVYRNPRFRRLVKLSVALGLALVSLAAGLGVLLLLNDRQAAAERAASNRLIGAERLLAEAAQARTTQPRKALQLGAAAVALNPSAGTRASLVETLGQSPYAGTIPVAEPVQSIAVNGTGRVLAAGTATGQLSLWEVRPTGPAVRRAAVPTGSAIRTISFAPDDRTLATGDANNMVTVWNVADPRHPVPLGTLSDHRGPIQSIAFDPAGRRVATASSDGAVMLWDFQDRSRPRPMATLRGHGGGAWAVAFSPDGKVLATGSADGAVKVWDVSDPRPHRLVDEVRGHTDIVRSIAFGVDQRVMVSGSLDATVKVWDLTRPGRINLRQRLAGHTGRVFHLAFAADGRTVASASYDRTAIVWDVPPRGAVRQLATLRGHSGYVRAVAFTPDGQRIVTGSLDGTMIIWKVSASDRPALAATMDNPGHRTRVVAFSSDRRLLVTGDSQGTVRIYDAGDRRRPRLLSTLIQLRNDVSDLAFSSDRGILAVASWDSRVLLWDVRDPSQPRRLGALTGHVGPVYSIAFSSTGRILASGGQDATVALWDVIDPSAARRLGTVRAHDEAVVSVDVSRDDKRLLTGSIDSAVKVWDIADPSRIEPLVTMKDHDEAVTAAYSPDGGLIAASSVDSTISLWRTAGSERPLTLTKFSGHSNPIRSQAFSSDGQLLVTGSEDGTATLFALVDPQHPTPLATIDASALSEEKGEPATAEHMAILGTAIDANTLALSRADGRVLLFDISAVQQLVTSPREAACARTVDALSPEDWASYLPDVPYQNACES